MICKFRFRSLLRFLDKLTWVSGTNAILANTPTLVTQMFSCNQKTLFDIGCGKGELLKSLLDADRISPHANYTIGFDIFTPSLKVAKKVHDDVIKCDIRSLPLRTKSCDIVMASQIIEHLTKNEGLKLLTNLKRVSKGTIIITVPVGHNPKQFLEDNNPWQTHKSAWHPDEFRARGFKVCGYAGARFLLDERGEYSVKSRILEPLFFGLTLFTQLITTR